MIPRLNSRTLVQALVRQCFIDDFPAFITEKGDDDRGGLILKVNHFSDKCELIQPMTDFDGERIWMSLSDKGFFTEKATDEMISKRRKFDTDLWVVEIEDPGFRFDINQMAF